MNAGPEPETPVVSPVKRKASKIFPAKRRLALEAVTTPSPNAGPEAENRFVTPKRTPAKTKKVHF